MAWGVMLTKWDGAAQAFWVRDGYDHQPSNYATQEEAEKLASLYRVDRPKATYETRELLAECELCGFPWSANLDDHSWYCKKLTAKDDYIVTLENAILSIYGYDTDGLPTNAWKVIGDVANEIRNKRNIK